METSASGITSTKTCTIAACSYNDDKTALPNIHFDRSTNNLKAIVDFDFGHTGSPLTEYLYSFPEF